MAVFWMDRRIVKPDLRPWGGDLLKQLGPGFSPYLLSFDGSNDYVSFPDFFTDAPQEITVECRLRVADVSAQYRPLSLNAQSPYVSFRLNDGGSGNLRVYVHSSQTPFDFTYSGDFSVERYIAVTASETTNEASLYIDGEKIHSASVGAFSRILDASSNLLGAGRSYNYYFKGAATSLRIWNKALDKTDIERNSRTTITGPRDGLVACYPFTEGAGNYLQDVSGNELEGEIYGATWIER